MVIRALCILLLAIAPLQAGAADFSVEKVAGVPSLGLGQCDLAAQGFVVEELFVEGSATSYKPAAPFTNSGDWNVTPDKEAHAKTRIVVVRPAESDRFNGTVVVEWLNVSAGQDAAPGWSLLHREILRSGYAYIGVSAQHTGVEGGGFSLTGSTNALKQSDPERYGSLSHPGDAYAYDLFSAAGRLAKQAGKSGVLGPLRPRHVLAMGESQSAVFLTTYINAIDPLAKIYDGFLVVSRFGSSASLGDAGMLGDQTLDAVRYRENLRVPVLTTITETDLLIQGGLPSYFAARQPDNEHLRTWEIPGAAHADTYLFAANARDCGNTPASVLAPLYAATSIPGLGLEKPINSGPQHHLVAMSALHHLNAWVSQGVAPPHGDRIQLADDGGSDAPLKLALDDRGLAKGGVRTPWVDVPLAKISGLGNAGGMLATLVGITEPFDQKTLETLYPKGKVEYLEKFRAALEDAVAAGFVLAADQAEMIALADVSYPATASP